MKNNYIKERDELLKSIDIIVQKRLKNLNFNRCIEARVVTDNGDGTYNIRINKDIINNVKAINSAIFQVDDVVYILIINNDFNNKKIMCTKYK